MEEEESEEEEVAVSAAGGTEEDQEEKEEEGGFRPDWSDIDARIEPSAQETQSHVLENQRRRSVN